MSRTLIVAWDRPGVDVIATLPRPSKGSGSPQSLAAAPSSPSTPDPGKERKPLPIVRLVYDDEFAPSTALVQTSDPGALQMPGARLLLYNDHLLTSALDRALEEATTLGCPPLTLALTFPFRWPAVSDEFVSVALAAVGALSEEHEEGSPGWLVLSCYLHAVLACEAAASPEAGAVVTEHTILLGASLRELELVQRNKRHAKAGRRSSRGGKTGAAGKARSFKERNLAIYRFMKAKVDAGAKVSEAAQWAFKEKPPRGPLGKSPGANEKIFRTLRKKLGS